MGSNAAEVAPAAAPVPRCIWVTGGTGLLGRAVAKVFRQSYAEATVLATGRTRGDPAPLDLTDQEAVQAFLALHQPDVILHCAAEKAPSVCEKDPARAEALNVTASETLARYAAAASSCYLIYISTDYVFDGTSPPYAEDAKPNPLMAYGATKLAGEQATLCHAAASAAILRVPVLYGPIERLEDSAVTVLARKLIEPICQVSNWQIKYPTHVEDVALVMRDMYARGLHGIFHFTASTAQRRYETLQTVAQALDMSAAHVHAVDTAPDDGAKRPYDAHLSMQRLADAGIAHERPLLPALKQVLEPFAEQLRQQSPGATARGDSAAATSPAPPPKRMRS